MTTQSISDNRGFHSGVTLLIVLALMVMFAMLITTFMIVTSQSRRTAETAAKYLIDPPSAAGGASGNLGHHSDTAAALNVLLTGGGNSAIAPHSILENLYGHPASGITGTFAETDNTNGTVSITDSADALKKNEIGNVLTIQFKDADGKEQVRSTFIRDVRAAENKIDFIPFAPADLAGMTNGQFLINLPAFSGTGAESDNTDGIKTENLQLNPNYTAPDYKTLFLAWNNIENNKLKNVIPSFHRPQLVTDWGKTTDLHKVTFRPLPTNHPDFTGSNPAATEANLQKFLTEGPWDVDSDGNGFADSVWIDAGFPNRYDEQTKTWYKPLVSYYIVDLDGRINVNTLGSIAQSETPPTFTGTNGNVNVKGNGFGAAELSSSLIPQSTLKKVLEGTTSKKGRYDEDKVPGKASSNLLRQTGINISAYEKGGIVPDWFGFSPITFDSLGNRTTAKPAATENPYLMNPYSDSDGDKPFQTDDLEFVLRSVGDVDYNLLNSTRLRELLGNIFNPKKPEFAPQNYRYNITARSSDIPNTTNLIGDTNNTLYRRVLTLCSDDATKAAELWKLLPEEVRRGEKVNLNRLTLRSDWTTGGADVLKAKAKFAQEIFYLLLVLKYDTLPIDSAEIARLAQWSVNLVDFIDPDSIMTPFVFHMKAPFGGGEVFDNTALIEQVIGNTLPVNTLSASGWQLIWGFEKPEVALTETFAVHNRRVADTEAGGGRVGGASPDNDFDQVLRPQGSLFVELYRQGNPQRTGYPNNDLIESDGTLNLAKTTSNDDYVWRLAIGSPLKASPQFTWDDGDTAHNSLYQFWKNTNKTFVPQFHQWTDSVPATGEYHPDLGVPERFVWFGNTTSPPKKDAPCSFYNEDKSDVTLAPNSYLVIAPRGITSFVSKDGSTAAGFGTHDTNALTGINLSKLTTTKKMIAINPLLPEYFDGTDESGSQVLTKVGVNVSEPLAGYTFDPATILDTPLDKNELNTRGTIACYKTICLQRLADPNRPHHPITNPYLTVDWNMIDLQVINSEKDSSGAEEESDISATADSDMRFSSRQWKTVTGSFSNLWDRTLSTEANEGLNDKKAGLEPKTGYTNRQGLVPNHHLGDRNFGTEPFLHFPWNDAPLTSTFELMLVPATTAGRFGVEFHDNQTAKFFDSKNRFSDPYHGGGLYLNFWDDKYQATDWAKVLFDYVRVPSRFTGTIKEWKNDQPVFEMREPGKININTLTQAGWDSLKGGRTLFEDYTKLKDERKTDSDIKPLTLFDLIGQELVKPDEAASNPYTVLENVMRLSDVTAARSNVFAVWITVGYFNVEKFESAAKLHEKYASLTDDEDVFKKLYPDGCVLGAEKGLDDGTVKRHRTFYLIDRSVPVGFRRGEKLNSENIVIKKTVLE